MDIHKKIQWQESTADKEAAINRFWKRPPDKGAAKQRICIFVLVKLQTVKTPGKNKLDVLLLKVQNHQLFRLTQVWDF